MARNPFQPFPSQRGPVKLFVYGEPGTRKTRRSLMMPGPRFVIDMEAGASDYGDLVDLGVDQYLPTKSYVEVGEALDYLLTLPEGKVGTLIIDPVTVIWQSLQMAHVERKSSKANIDPDEVDFDVGVWGKLKRLYGDLMTELLNAPFHVVLVARGAEKINAAGKKLPYGYDGEKSTVFLMNTVIETHADHDVVIKDRTGTYTERQTVDTRVDFRSLLAKSGTTPVRMQSETETARRDASDLTPEKVRRIAIDAIRNLDWLPEHIKAVCARWGVEKPQDIPPSHWTEAVRIFGGPPPLLNPSPEAK